MVKFTRNSYIKPSEGRKIRPVKKKDRIFFSFMPVFALVCILFLSGCSKYWRKRADDAANNIIIRAQQDALGKTEPFTIETPAETLRRKLILEQDLPYAAKASLGTASLDRIKHWPDDGYIDESLERPYEGPELTSHTLPITLTDALQIAAQNSREYQSRKEDVYRTALDLDLEDDEFRSTFAGTWQTLFSSNFVDEDENDGYHLEYLENRGDLGWSKKFKTGAEFTTNLGLDLAHMLSNDTAFSRGLTLDATIFVPLLRGAGSHIVAEPLTQQERNVIYSIYDFERYKRTFAVQIASDYLGVIQQMDEVQNSEDNYRRLVTARRRARRLSDAGRLPEIQVDQASQDELRARNRWIAARQRYARQLDSLKIQLGLPADANISLDPDAMERMAESSSFLLEKMSDSTKEPVQETSLSESIPADAPVELREPDPEDAGPLEMEEIEAVLLALQNRLDLRNAVGRVFDAQRKVVVAANGLLPDADVTARGSWGESRSGGSADQPDANIEFEEGDYSIQLDLALPLERTSERNRYRESLISLEDSVRNVQSLEDQVKFQVRNNLRTLLESRESVRIQAQSVQLAERRVDSTNLFLEAGRAEIRDLLDAQEDLVSARNALTAALISYRISELELQQNMGVLQVGADGLWVEYTDDAWEPSRKLDLSGRVDIQE